MNFAPRCNRIWIVCI